ncbi:MFS transporter [Saccharothrix australiensis]|uniref:Putative MFS family arabinose efflux permease n=1 Tax=Saccharothrix australiensis TaxID=2072 RepID=A0A495W0E3_9PSEU|nr:MFS transporter [Saccharothrix australiensis]RKT53348.1 putative MFS family arabinose efflux permease [Saccharothrix australiensis]
MSLWLHRDFRLLWAGDTVSQFGSTIGQTVLPLLAAGALAATPWQMGLLTAANSAAFLLIGLPAGVWVDRMRRRPVMLAADAVRAALMLSIPLAWWLGTLTFAHLVVVALLVGAATVLFDVAYQSYLPALVGRDQLVEGNSKLTASHSVAHVSGPAAAGGVAQAVGAANGVLATGLGYLWSALFLLRIRAVEPESPAAADRPGLRSEIAEGLRFVFADRSLRAIVCTTGTANFFDAVGTAVMVLFLSRALGLSDGVIGLLFSAAGVGGVLGALTASRWNRRFGLRAVWLSLLVTQPFGLLLPFAGADWRLALVVVADLALAYGATVYNIVQVSYRQAICPDHLLGRMNASVRFVVWGALPLGGLVGGLLGEQVGIMTALWVAMVGRVLAAGWVLCSPLRRRDAVPA